MKTISITAGPVPAVVIIENNRLVSAERTDKIPSEPADIVFVHNSVDKTKLTHYKNIQEVEPLKALIYSALCTNRVEKAAFICSTRYSVELGLYEKGNITVLKSFEYPNSLELFVESIQRFCGHNYVDIEDFDTNIQTWYLQHVLNPEYQLLQNLERGFGGKAPNKEFYNAGLYAYYQVIMELSKWVTDATRTDFLIVTGGPTKHPILLDLLYNEHFIIIPPTSDTSILALGGAAAYTDFVYDSVEQGSKLDQTFEADELAHLLQTYKPIYQKHGRIPFSDRYLGRKSKLIVPIKDLVESYIDIPLYAVKKEFYNEYFDGNAKDWTGQYYHRGAKRHLKSGRVITTDMTKHPYLNRILTVLYTEAGFPIVQIIDDKI